MPDIYADSFGGLTQADLAYQQIRSRALESALGNATAALAGMRQRQQQANQFHAQLLQRQDETAKTLALTAQHYKDIADYQHGMLDLSRKQLDWQQKQPTAADTRGRDLAFQYAAGAASRGEDISDIPGLEPTEKAVLEKVGVEGQRQSDALSKAAEMDAQTLNQHRDLSNAYKQTDEYLKSQPFYLRALPEAMQPDGMKLARQNLKGFDESRTELAPRVQEILKVNEKTGHLVKNQEGDWAVSPSLRRPQRSMSNAYVQPQSPTGETPSETGWEPAGAPIRTTPQLPTATTSAAVTPAAPPTGLGGAATATGTTGEPTVDVQTPDGRIWRNLPVSRLPAAKARGAVVITPTMPTSQQLLGP